MKPKWEIVKLSDILAERKEKPDLDEIHNGKIPIIAKIGFDAGKIELREKGKTKTNMILVKPGDLVISGINAAKGAIAVYNDENDRMLAATIHYSSYIIDKEKVDSIYLWYFLRSNSFRKILIGNLPKGIKTEVKPVRFLPIKISLPDLASQKVIVRIISNLIDKIQQAKNLREMAIKYVENALNGELDRLFGNPYKNKYGLFDVDDFSRLNEVVDDVADGPHATPTYVEDGIPFITVLNITSGCINFSEVKYITLEDHQQYKKRAFAEKGDVLISKDGTIGVPCYVDTSQEFSFFVSVALIKPRRDLLDGRFFTWSLKSPYLQERMKERSRGDMICHLVLREIRDLIIPIPPIQEQINIVEYLNTLQHSIDKLNKLQVDTEEEIEELIPSIFQKVFRGELFN